MQNNLNVLTKAQIDLKIVKGDYITLGKMIGKESNAARMRYNREDTDAVNAMRKIVETRDELITTHKKEQ